MDAVGKHLKPGEESVKMGNNICDLNDVRFFLYDVLKVEELCQAGRYQDHSRETFEMTINTAEKLAVMILCRLMNRGIRLVVCGKMARFGFRRFTMSLIESWRKADGSALRRIMRSEVRMYRMLLIMSAKCSFLPPITAWQVIMG